MSMDFGNYQGFISQLYLYHCLILGKLLINCLYLSSLSVKWGVIMLSASKDCVK